MKRRATLSTVAAAAAALALQSCTAFVPSPQQQQQPQQQQLRHTAVLPLQLSAAAANENNNNSNNNNNNNHNNWGALAAATLLSMTLAFGPASPAQAENELSAKYGGGLDTSLVDQNCLVDSCSLQATACLVDDASCRKGLTCTAKCLGDNACITGCMARYGNENLDNLLKCTIEDHECIKVAILPGGADALGEEPKAPAPTIQQFNVKSLEGAWYKVVGYNPNYDCYACQRNTFSPGTNHHHNNNAKKDGLLFVNHAASTSKNTLNMDVEFSMPHLLPDGSPAPPTGGVKETLIAAGQAGGNNNMQPIGLNSYSTHETMVFDTASDYKNAYTLQDKTYARTAHSEGEMFGLKFWENWYVIGENDPGQEEFKFIFYNGKTRQNTYEGAFIYSRTQELSPASLAKVQQIARDAGMNPDQFCRIRNQGCFPETEVQQQQGDSSNNVFRGILASTKVSQLLGVEPVAARDTIRSNTPTAKILNPPEQPPRAWWYEVGDYLENPHRHFAVMDRLRQPMEWPVEQQQAALEE